MIAGGDGARHHVGIDLGLAVPVEDDADGEKHEGKAEHGGEPVQRTQPGRREAPHWLQIGTEIADQTGNVTALSHGLCSSWRFSIRLNAHPRAQGFDRAVKIDLQGRFRSTGMFGCILQ